MVKTKILKIIDTNIWNLCRNLICVCKQVGINISIYYWKNNFLGCLWFFKKIWINTLAQSLNQMPDAQYVLYFSFNFRQFCVDWGFYDLLCPIHFSIRNWTSLVIITMQRLWRRWKMKVRHCYLCGIMIMQLMIMLMRLLQLWAIRQIKEERLFLTISISIRKCIICQNPTRTLTNIG